MKKVIKLFLIIFIILISCDSEIESENSKIDTFTQERLNAFIKSTQEVKKRFSNSTCIDDFMFSVLEIETLIEFMPENRQYITLEDVRYIADYFVTNYYVKGAKSVDEAKQFIIDRHKKIGLNVFESIEEIGYHNFTEDLLKEIN